MRRSIIQRNFYHQRDVQSVLRLFGHAKAHADVRLVSNGMSDRRARGDCANLLITSTPHQQPGLALYSAVSLLD